VDYTNILRKTLENGSGIVKFFKSLDYTFSQCNQAEEDLKRALETISSENDELSSKAQEWLRNFDIMIKSLSIERHWTSTKVNEKRKKTQALELISAEKEEQHFYNVRSNIAVEYDSASDDFQVRTQRLSSFKEPSDSKKMKSSGKTPTIDVVYDGYETSTSDYTSADTEEKSTNEMLLIDLAKFEEAYSKLDPNCMWVLESGRKVKEVIYEFARNLPRESCLHSFIINDADADVKGLFSDVEWKEITGSEVKENLKIGLSLRDLMIKYTVKSIKELRKIIYEPFILDGSEYDKNLHHDLDFINYAYWSMLFLWDREENPFDSSKLEGWYEMNIWGHLIDLIFHDINIDLVRGECMSCASSDRKNIIRMINDRKKIGRKRDGVFKLCKDRLEFGAIEAGRKWEGHNGTKYLNDSLKLNKMMKDMIVQLTTICDWREDLVRKLEVIGILHGANRIQIITMDYLKGYISHIRHRKFYEVSGRLTKSNPLALVLKEILYAKYIILRTLDLINQKDDINIENFLNDSDEQDGCRTPPFKVNIAPTFKTLKTARTKDVINKK
ncbi:7630_t:CDS:2, partial [Funneliformis mosseae]